jgi:hypothetical protein
MKPEKFEKLPVVIEAILFTGDNGGELREFVGSALSWNPLRNEAHIATEEGIMRANAGDWIIRGVKGEFYPCKPDIFAATYKPAGPATVTAQPERDDRDLTGNNYKASRVFKELVRWATYQAEICERVETGAGEHNGQGWVRLPQLPPEDEKVLVAVMSEADDHSTGMTVRFPEVYRGTIYTAPGMVIADCEGGGEYEDEEILGWRPLPAPPEGQGAEK